MMFIVRGKNRNHDAMLRVRARSAKEAESIGFKRGLFVTEVTRMEDPAGDVGRLDRVKEKVWRAWKQTPTSPFTCFGRVVTNGQAMTLVLCGLATWALDLRTLVFN